MIENTGAEKGWRAFWALRLGVDGLEMRLAPDGKLRVSMDGKTWWTEDPVNVARVLAIFSAKLTALLASQHPMQKCPSCNGHSGKECMACSGTGYLVLLGNDVQGGLMPSMMPEQKDNVPGLGALMGDKKPKPVPPGHGIMQCPRPDLN